MQRAVKHMEIELLEKTRALNDQPGKVREQVAEAERRAQALVKIELQEQQTKFSELQTAAACSEKELSKSIDALKVP